MRCTRRPSEMQSGAIRGHPRCNLEPSHLHEHRLVRSPRHQPEDLDALRLSDAMRATHSGSSRVLRGTQRHSGSSRVLRGTQRHSGSSRVIRGTPRHSGSSRVIRGTPRHSAGTLSGDRVPARCDASAPSPAGHSADSNRSQRECTCPRPLS
jgi:hypothetical protein